MNPRALTLFLAGTLLAAAALTLPACDARSTADAADTIRFGIVPVEGGMELTDRFIPLFEHIERETGLAVEPFSASTYSGVIVAMANNQLDFAYFGAKSYVEASRRAAAEVLAMEVSAEGRPGYYGIVVARADSDIDSLEDARGTRFAFVDPNSTSGYLVPRTLLERDHQIIPEEYFSQVIFTNSHRTSILQVVNGDIDTAATNTLDLLRSIERGGVREGELRELWRSELIPGQAISARREVPDDIKAAVRDAIVSFDDPEGLARLQSGGFLPADDTQYDVIRYLMDRAPQPD